MKKIKFSDKFIGSTIGLILAFSIFMIIYNYEYKYKIKQDICNIKDYYQRDTTEFDYIIDTWIIKYEDRVYNTHLYSKRIDLCFNLQYEKEKAKHYIDSVKAEKKFIRDIKRKCR